MTDEQSVRNALDYEIEPWTPDPAELIRRGRRGLGPPRTGRGGRDCPSRHCRNSVRRGRGTW